jgi:DNA repair protein RecO (recombination protein O)
VRLVAKGARRGGGRFGAALDPFVVSGVVFYLRDPRSLSLVSQADSEREFRVIRADVTRQAYASVALELLDRLVADGAPDPELFDSLACTLEGFDESSDESLAPLLWSFELALAERLGYSPELDRCCLCGRVAEDACFSIDAGGTVCAACGPDDSDFGPEVVGVLRGLRSRRGVDLPAERRDRLADDVGRALRGLLERYSGLNLKLRSQAVLDSLERASRARATGAAESKEEN